MFIDVILEQPAKVLASTEVMLEGIVKLIKDSQSLNAPLPIDVTLSGTMILVRLPHSWKAFSGIDVPPSLNSRLFRLVQPAKILDPKLATLPGIVIVVRLEHPLKAYSSIDVTVSGISILVRAEHPIKAPSPIDVTLLGIEMLVRAVQFLKANSLMAGTP